MFDTIVKVITRASYLRVAAFHRRTDQTGAGIDFLPSSTYNAQGGLRQGPGHASKSQA